MKYCVAVILERLLPHSSSVCQRLASIPKYDKWLFYFIFLYNYLIFNIIFNVRILQHKLLTVDKKLLETWAMNLQK